MSVIHMTVSSPYDKLMLKIHAKKPCQKKEPCQKEAMPKSHLNLSHLSHLSHMDNAQQALLEALSPQLVASVMSMDNGQFTLASLKHHRLSLTSADGQKNAHRIMYQGISSGNLTDGVQRCQRVIIKWQMKWQHQPSHSDFASLNPDYSDYSDFNMDMSLDLNVDLNTQIKRLTQLSKNNLICTDADICRIALPLYGQSDLPLTLDCQQDKRMGRLSVMLLPYFDMGSLQQICHQSQSKQSANAQQADSMFISHLILQAALALQQVHDAKLIHGDVKPSNFLLSSSPLNSSASNSNFTALPLVHITDFALAQPQRQFHRQSQLISLSLPIAGTPAYLAPECWAGRGVSIASDVYAFGLMVYQLLTHTRAGQAYVASSMSDIDRSQAINRLQAWKNWHTSRHSDQHKTSLKLPTQWQSWQNVINACVQYQPNKRPQNMQAVIKLLPTA